MKKKGRWMENAEMEPATSHEGVCANQPTKQSPCLLPADLCTVPGCTTRFSLVLHFMFTY